MVRKVNWKREGSSRMSHLGFPVREGFSPGVHWLVPSWRGRGGSEAGFDDSSWFSWTRWCRKNHEAWGEALRVWKVTDMKGIPPVEPHELVVRGIPISDLPEAAGKG